MPLGRVAPHVRDGLIGPEGFDINDFEVALEDVVVGARGQNQHPHGASVRQWTKGVSHLSGFNF